MIDPPTPPDWMGSTLDDDSPILDSAVVGTYLTMVQGAEPGRRYRLLSTLSLGRSSEAQIVLNDNRVSSIHCQVKRDKDTVTVEDNGSRNGTFIDEVRIQGP